MRVFILTVNFRYSYRKNRSICIVPDNVWKDKAIVMREVKL